MVVTMLSRECATRVPAGFGLLRTLSLAEDLSSCAANIVVGTVAVSTEGFDPSHLRRLSDRGPATKGWGPQSVLGNGASHPATTIRIFQTRVGPPP